MTAAETMSRIVMHYKRGRISYSEATKVIFQTVTRHKYTPAWIDAATAALKAIS